MEKVTSEEDAALRRLHWFTRQGCELAAPVAQVASSIRSRDKRSEVREPTDAAVLGADASDRVRHRVGQARRG